MDIFHYDIWDGDKGIILAKNLDEAKEVFKKNYPGTPLDTEVDSYDSGVCCLEHVGLCTDYPRLYFIEG